MRSEELLGLAYQKKASQKSHVILIFSNADAVPGSKTSYKKERKTY